jgi:hypothetical protein
VGEEYTEPGQPTDNNIEKIIYFRYVPILVYKKKYFLLWLKAGYGILIFSCILNFKGWLWKKTGRIYLTNILKPSWK